MIVVMRHGGDVGLIWWVSGLIGGPDLLGLGGDCGPAIHGFDLVGEWVLVVCIGGASATAVWLDWAGFGSGSGSGSSSSLEVDRMYTTLGFCFSFLLFYLISCLGCWAK